MREEHAEAAKTLDLSRVHFLDECGSHLGMTPAHGLAPKGSRCVSNAPKGRGRSVTILGALTLDGLGAVMTIEGGTDTSVFLAYIEHVLGPTLKPGDTVVMDNLRVHKTASVLAAFEKLGVEVLFLPPYSPDMNPIELAWSKLKTWLRAAKARTLDLLNFAIAQGMSTITSSDAAAWMRHAGYHHVM